MNQSVNNGISAKGCVERFSSDWLIQDLCTQPCSRCCWKYPGLEFLSTRIDSGGNTSFAGGAFVGSFCEAVDWYQWDIYVHPVLQNDVIVILWCCMWLGHGLCYVVTLLCFLMVVLVITLKKIQLSDSVRWVPMLPGEKYFHSYRWATGRVGMSWCW